MEKERASSAYFPFGLAEGQGSPVVEGVEGMGALIGSVVDWVLLSQLEIILVYEVIGFDVDRQEWREEDARGSRH